MELLSRAQSGDQQAFAQLTDGHRQELKLHCYRILGSTQDAEDALQETFLAAWQALANFEERASIRTWLYRIATNRCLNMLRAASRRPEVASSPTPPLHSKPETWTSSSSSSPKTSRSPCRRYLGSWRVARTRDATSARRRSAPAPRCGLSRPRRMASPRSLPTFVTHKRVCTTRAVSLC